MTLWHESGKQMLNKSPVRTMEYPAFGKAPAAAVPDRESPESLARRVRELESEIEAREREFALRLESERQSALERGRQLAGDEKAAWRAECSAGLQRAVDAFRAQRDDYFARVEHEVVQLALAVAERILHREAQLDPMLLSGAVRVALGQLSASTEVRLRVPAAEKDLWEETVRLMPGLPLRPEVHGEDGLHGGELILESSLGSVDLGVKAQLTEIER
ncbi:MAG: FliH/SctL family protein, partial [Acidobacteriota bacterium]